MRKGHWTDVPPNEIPGVEYVEHGGLRLMVRPRQVHAKAVAYEQNQAREVIRDHEQMVLGGNLPGVSGANHESAIRSNRLNKSRERLVIAADE